MGTFACGGWDSLNIPCILTRTDRMEVKLKETETLRRLGVKPGRTDSNSVFSREGRELMMKYK